MFESLTNSVVEFGIKVLKLLPESPFVVLDELAASPVYEWLQYLNWFIPINTFVVILEAWGVGVGLYYLYQIVFRWLKVIE